MKGSSLRRTTRFVSFSDLCGREENDGEEKLVAEQGRHMKLNLDGNDGIDAVSWGKKGELVILPCLFTKF